MRGDSRSWNQSIPTCFPTYTHTHTLTHLDLRHINLCAIRSLQVLLNRVSEFHATAHIHRNVDVVVGELKQLVSHPSTRDPDDDATALALTRCEQQVEESPLLGE